jgi:hypothetical protein
MGPVLVGAAAIIVSTIFNWWALRRSSQNLRLAQKSFERTEQKYRLDRIDARNDKVRAAIVELSSAITSEWVPACLKYESALATHGRQLESANPGDLQLAETMKQLTVVSVEDLLPAQACVQAAVTNSRLLAEGVQELIHPLKALAAGFASDIGPEPTGPTDVEGFFVRAQAMKAHRQKVQAQTNQLVFAGIALLSSATSQKDEAPVAATSARNNLGVLFC